MTSCGDLVLYESKEGLLLSNKPFDLRIDSGNDPSTANFDTLQKALRRAFKAECGRDVDLREIRLELSLG